MNALTQHIDEVISPVPQNRAARRRQQQAWARDARQTRRGRRRIERALSAFEKGTAA